MELWLINQGRPAWHGTISPQVSNGLQMVIYLDLHHGSLGRVWTTDRAQAGPIHLLDAGIDGK